MGDKLKSATNCKDSKRGEAFLKIPELQRHQQIIGLLEEILKVVKAIRDGRK
ncbi:MAG: hypothetical protein HZA50_11810 [Planctomycetes bacterium]|nr:hypothetical protein [Planctomycetota bacterium]